MGEKILVAYGSKYGGTKEISERIATEIQKTGRSVDVQSAKGIKDLSSFQAVILGSGVYMGFWRREASRFLKSNEKSLKKKQVWLFSSGPFGKGDPKELAEGWGFPKSLQAVADRINPRDIRMFHGVLFPDKIKGFDKWVMNKMDIPDKDSRDWEDITNWARSIAQSL